MASKLPTTIITDMTPNSIRKMESCELVLDRIEDRQKIMRTRANITVRDKSNLKQNIQPVKRQLRSNASVESKNVMPAKRALRSNSVIEEMPLLTPPRRVRKRNINDSNSFDSRRDMEINNNNSHLKQTDETVHEDNSNVSGFVTNTMISKNTINQSTPIVERAHLSTQITPAKLTLESFSVSAASTLVDSSDGKNKDTNSITNGNNRQSVVNFLKEFGINYDSLASTSHSFNMDSTLMIGQQSNNDRTDSSNFTSQSIFATPLTKPTDGIIFRYMYHSQVSRSVFDKYGVVLEELKKKLAEKNPQLNIDKNGGVSAEETVPIEPPNNIPVENVNNKDKNSSNRIRCNYSNENRLIFAHGNEEITFAHGDENMALTIGNFDTVKETRFIEMKKDEIIVIKISNNDECENLTKRRRLVSQSAVNVLS